MTTYNPFNHYWLAEDGRLFSSASQGLVESGAAQFTAWPGVPSPWPRDDAGVESDAALQEVLRPYFISVNLSYYAAQVRWVKIQTGITVNGVSFPCDALTLNALNSATIYTESTPGAGAVINWKLPDGTFAQLDKTEIKELQLATQSFCQACYNCESTTLDGIAAGTVTTREQVDEAFAAIQTEFSKTQAPEGLTISETLLRR